MEIQEIINNSDLESFLEQKWNLNRNHLLPSRIFGPNYKNRPVIEAMTVALQKKGFQVYIFDFDNSLNQVNYDNIIEFENDNLFSMDISDIGKDLYSFKEKILEELLSLDNYSKKDNLIRYLCKDIKNTVENNKNILEYIKSIVNDLLAVVDDEKLNKIMNKIVKLKNLSNMNKILEEKAVLFSEITDYIASSNNNNNNKLLQNKPFDYLDLKDKNTYNTLKILRDQLEITSELFSKDQFNIRLGSNLFKLGRFDPSIRLLFFIIFLKKLRHLKNNNKIIDTYIIVNLDELTFYDFLKFVDLNDLRRDFLGGTLGLCLCSNNYKQMEQFQDTSLDIFTKTFSEYEKHISTETYVNFKKFDDNNKLFINLKHSW